MCPRIMNGKLVFGRAFYHSYFIFVLIIIPGGYLMKVNFKMDARVDINEYRLWWKGTGLK